MNTDMNANIDERALLRFASGEMPEEEESEFIARCEIAGESAPWRAAVLAIVEHRRIVSALTELADETVPSLAVSPLPAKIAPKPHKTYRSTALAALTSLAAGLLVGVIAMHFRDTPRDVGPASQPSVAQNNAITPNNPQAAPIAKIDVPQPINATPVSLQEGRFLGLEPMIREDQAASLRKQGFQVEERPTVYIIDGGNGRKWAVPTQKTTVHYVNRSE